MTNIAARVSASGTVLVICADIAVSDLITKVGEGTYMVTPPSSVPSNRVCVSACLADAGSGSVTAVSLPNGPVIVTTYDSAGDAADRSFTVTLALC